jgi:hypothetical protein
MICNIREKSGVLVKTCGLKWRQPKRMGWGDDA